MMRIILRDCKRLNALAVGIHANIDEYIYFKPAQHILCMTFYSIIDSVTVSFTGYKLQSYWQLLPLLSVC